MISHKSVLLTWEDILNIFVLFYKFVLMYDTFTKHEIFLLNLCLIYSFIFPESTSASVGSQ